jgi:drug/metabolite transporter (DMT)-like permease
VGTYAYVNPVVAVALGYFVGGESVGTRTLLGALLVLISVISITTIPRKAGDARKQPELSIAEAD